MSKSPLRSRSVNALLFFIAMPHHHQQSL